MYCEKENEEEYVLCWHGLGKCVCERRFLDERAFFWGIPFPVAMTWSGFGDASLEFSYHFVKFDCNFWLQTLMLLKSHQKLRKFMVKASSSRSFQLLFTSLCEWENSTWMKLFLLSLGFLSCEKRYTRIGSGKAITKQSAIKSDGQYTGGFLSVW